MAEPMSNKERLKEITDGIEQGIKDLFESDRYAQYLRTMSRFHKYSVNNVMLINMQKPDATLVAGFDKWRDQFERHVKKGEHGIKIIAPTPFKKKQEQEKIDPVTHIPMRDRDGKIVTEEVEVKIPMYKPVAVFDVSQTEGKALPQLAADLTGDVRQYEIFMEALRRSSPVPISVEAMAADMDGFFSQEAQRIAVRAGMSEVQTVSAAVHEIGHAKLHNIERDRLAAATEGKEPPKPKDRHTEEVEAESVSYAVCQYYGIQTGENSFGYIANWSKGKELPELRASLEVINKTASGLITDIDRHFSDICKERGVDLTAPEQAATVADTQEREGFYALDDTAYLHVQASESGYDYTLYDRQTWRSLDGGQLDNPDISLTAARDEILAMHELTPERVEPASLDILDEILAEPELPPTMPRRYGVDENRDAQRLWNGKAPEEFTEQDTLLFMADTDLKLHGEVTPDTLAAMEQAGFNYDNGQLTPIAAHQPPYDVMEFSDAQWAQITAGWDAGVDVSAYARPDVPAEEMAARRRALEQAPIPPAPTMLPDAPMQALDEYPMPDPDLTVADLEKCGYLDGDMLPLSHDRALELLQKDYSVYAIVGDNAEMLFDKGDFDTQEPGALFAVTREEWEGRGEFDRLIRSRLEHQEQREAAFLQSPKDTFAIYQLKEGAALRDIRYEPLSWLESKGAAVERDNYDLAYTGRFTVYAGLRNRLEELWDRFNNDHPADYHRPSLSVSDIIAVKHNGKVSCHYCDSFDFVELPGFLQRDNPLKNAEMATEDDYGMIDGILNNGPKQPTVAELESQVKAGGQISVLDLARAVHAEQGDKKKSVLEQLKKQQPQSEHKKAAPHKGAEREI